MDGIGIGGGGVALLGDGRGGCASETSVCVEIDIIFWTRSSAGGGGGALVGDIGVRGGLRGSSRVCDAEETIAELVGGSMTNGGLACTRFRR